MIGRRLFLVFGRDLAHNGRRIIFLIWVALLIFMAWSLSTGKARIQSGDSSVGGPKSFITSEFAVAQVMMVLVPLIYGFFGSVTAGMAVMQDEEYRVGELLHSSPLRPGEYIWGKFLAVMATILAVLAIHLAAMMFFNHAFSSSASQEFRGPLILNNYLRPALIFTLPTIIFFAGVAFAVGEWSRRPIPVYFLPVAVLLSCVFFLWDWSPSWLDPRVDRFLMLIDPAGFRWLTETHLKVDRGVNFYNTQHIPLDSTMIANRLIFLTIGLGAVVLSQRHFAASLRGVSRRAERAWKKRPARFDQSQESNVTPPPSLPLSSLAMTSRPPGLFQGTWAVMQSEVAELRSSPGLYLFIPLMVLQVSGVSMLAVGAFDTPLLLTSGTIAMRSLNWLTTLTCMLLLFYMVESLWRERRTRLAAISLATPIRTGSILLGKSLANSLVGLAVIFLDLAAAFAILLWQWKVGFEVIPFALVWGALLLPTLLLWTSFVMATLSLTRSRFSTYGIALFVLGFTAFRQITGEINWVGNWPLWSAVRWSDISIMELDRTAILLNRIMALGLAALFIVITARFYNRRELDATAMVTRFRAASILRSALWLLPVAVVPIAAGAVLWSKVDEGFQGEASKKRQKDYWRKNLATYKDWPLPEITNVEIAVELDPAHGRLKVSGWYDLRNHQTKAISQIPVSPGLGWESPQWTLDGQEVKPNDRAGLYIFTPTTTIPSGGQPGWDSALPRNSRQELARREAGPRNSSCLRESS